MNNFLDNLRPKKSVIKRTKPLGELPKLALYVEWITGTRQRKVIDLEGAEHVLDDKTVESYYRLVTGSQAKGHIEKNWKAVVEAEA